RDRALEVARVRQHRDLDDAERARTKFQDGEPRVIRVDTSGEPRCFRHDTFDRSHEPLNQVDVVRRLIHDRTAVELPRPTPRRLIVVLLRARPAYGRVGEIDATEPTAIDGPLEQLNRGVQAILLDD